MALAESVLLHKKSNNSSIILLHKPLSTPSFGHYWKQPIQRPYWLIILMTDTLFYGIFIKVQNEEIDLLVDINYIIYSSFKDCVI